MGIEGTLRLKSGDPVRIDGRLFNVGSITSNGRSFIEKETGLERHFTNVAQIRMARDGRITSDAMFEALTTGVKLALETDWDAHLPSERAVAQMRHAYCAAVLEKPANRRHKKAVILMAISEVHAKDRSGEPAPSPRQVRDWTKTYEASGRDIRSLSSLSFRKGRAPRMLDWIREEIVGAIHDVYATPEKPGLAETQRRAIDRIRDRAMREGRELPCCIERQRDVIGVNAVARVLATLDQYPILEKRYGKKEADRIMEAVRSGPQGTYPLEGVEIDHTMLDVMVIDEDNKMVLGRPWLTVLLDRYSRAILGFCISFHPPSWTTVMEALRHGVSYKDEWLKELGGITNAWPCHGVPDVLVCDNGRDFHSNSMEATEAALNMRILYLPRGKGWLKGKIERWFGTIEGRIFHLIPGTTMSNVVERKDYDSAAFAVMSLAQIRWIIAKWIVDVYHYEEHSATGEAPIERWTNGMLNVGEKLPPPDGLLVPLTGMVVRTTLTRDGVRFKNLRWNSNAFSLLRNHLEKGDGVGRSVLARIDPLDLKVAFVFDERKRKWIEGELVTDGIEANLTLHQYEVIQKRARETRAPDESRLEAISRARREIFDFVQAIIADNTKSKAGKRFARFRHDGRKPAEHIAATATDPVKSNAALGSHALPGRKAKAKAPLQFALPTPAVDDPKTSVASASVVDAGAAAPTLDGIIELTVRRRRL